MKKKNFFKPILLLFLAIGTFYSCDSEDDAPTEPEPTFNPPSITLSATSGSFVVGQTIRLTAELDAEALLSEVTVTLAGAQEDRVTYTSQGSATYSFTRVVLPTELGATLEFVFTVTDTLGETDTATYTAQIGAIAPAYQIEEVVIEGTTFKRVTGEINLDETFDSASNWLLNGPVQVADLATLTIEPGTKVYAADATTILDVQIGGTLIADGTAAAPIIFTTINAAPGQSGTPEPSNWVGININGDDSTTGNSGILRYVRIEYGGNGDEPLQFRQVGGGTTVDYVQVYNAGDTGVRMRGGYVNVKHLVVTKPSDHGVRYSDGWEGNGQFWVILTDRQDTEGLIGRDTETSPRTSNPILSNAIVVGPFLTADGAGDTDGVQVRDGGRGQFHNFVVTGFDDSFRNRSAAGDMVIKNSLVFGNGQAGDEDGLHSSVRDDYRLAENNNVEDEPITLVDNYVGVSTTNPSDASTLGDFFDAVSFVGAVEANADWTAGWTLNFDGTPRN